MTSVWFLVLWAVSFFGSHSSSWDMILVLFGFCVWSPSEVRLRVKSPFHWDGVFLFLFCLMSSLLFVSLR